MLDHNSPGKLHSQLFPVCLLPVKRDTVHILLVHHVSNCGWRCETMLQQRAWGFRPNDYRSTVFFTFRTAQDLLDILDPFHFRGDDPQLFTDNLFPDDCHRGVAVGTVPVLVRHLRSSTCCQWKRRRRCYQCCPRGTGRFYAEVQSR